MEKEWEGNKPPVQRHFRPDRALVMGFLILILAGTLLLSLPAASRNGKSAGFFESLFTASSAVCVTGLTLRDTLSGWSGLGQGIILVLIQLGGLGFMVFATLIMVALGRRINLRGRMLLKESMNENSLSGLVRLTLTYGLMALGIELAGAALLAIRFIPLYGAGRGIYFSFFHAVSAFCNAGFDLFGKDQALTGFAGDPFVLLIISALVILGGLGFSVILECVQHRFRWRTFSLHAKLVFMITGILLAAGGIFFTLAEWENPDTLGPLSRGEKILNGFFQGVTLRTAGFSAISQKGLRDASKLAGIFLMSIGASPASTGGGVKTTTAGVLVLLVISAIRGHDEVQLMGRRLPGELIRRAIVILCISLFFLLLGGMMISLTEEGRISFLDGLYECASALATAGVSSAGTCSLRKISQAILIPMMFLGRVGPLTLALALARRQHQVKDSVKYPEEKLMIG